MKKKGFIILIAIVALISSLVIWRHSTNLKLDEKETGDVKTDISDEIFLEDVNKQANESVKIVKESTTSPYISLFDRYNSIEYISDSIEFVEEGLYKGVVSVSAPDFQEAFNEYVIKHNDDSFETENYEYILEEILSSANVEISEHEIYFYINERDELIPVLNDNVINAMYGNIQDLYFNELFKQNQKGNRDEN